MYFSHERICLFSFFWSRTINNKRHVLYDVFLRHIAGLSLFRFFFLWSQTINNERFFLYDVFPRHIAGLSFFHFSFVKKQSTTSAVFSITSLRHILPVHSIFFFLFSFPFRYGHKRNNTHRLLYDGILTFIFSFSFSFSGHQKHVFPRHFEMDIWPGSPPPFFGPKHTSTSATFCMR